MAPPLSDTAPTDAQRESAALEWLFSFADQERGVGWNPNASVDEQWLLGRTRALLDLAGAPDRALRCVLVAGTKGKGSTSVLLASLLDRAGLRVGLYTKPHLQRYRERIRLGGTALGPAAFAQAVDRFRPIVAEFQRRYRQAGQPTTFEVTTALAIDTFARADCEVAVLEVGLGGRLDATNSVSPALSVIASISYDHTAILGKTLPAIAREKAGILRPGVPALFAQQRPAAARALARSARQVGAPYRFVSPLAGVDDYAELQANVAVPLAEGQAVSARLSLVGEGQRQNAALAVAAAGQLVELSPDGVRDGLARVHWPGRFEVVARSPALVLDGAHNDASANLLAGNLAAFAHGRPIALVLGIMADKDARAVMAPLVRLAACVVATSVQSPRALPPAQVARLARRHGAGSVQTAESLGEAIQAARQSAGTDGVVCVTGSLALVGAARDVLGLAVPERLWDPD